MSEQELGCYTGKLILEPLQDGQQLKTVLEFGFLDVDGKHWPVPPGTSVDGASIPKALVSLWGGPWQGKFREASVLHDYHCAARSADWQSVDRMFYRAMLASGVSEPHAKLVYAGVYFAGPHWERMADEPTQLSHAAHRTQTAPGDILYALCRDPITLAVSEAIECEGMSAFNWITHLHQPTDRNADIVLKLDKLSEMVEEDAPSLRNLEAAIDYAVGLIPNVEGSPRSISVGRRLVMLD
jgi:Protein of unknown function (DUF1353)